MAASADGSVKVTLTGNLKNTLTDGQSVTTSIGTSVNVSLTNGTAASQFNRGWQSLARTLNSAATEDIDLYDLGSLDVGAGAGEDALGLTLTATAIVALCIENKSTSAGTLLIGGKAATTAWNSPFAADDDAKLSIPPSGGVLLWATGATAFAVADTTNHLLKLEASGGTCNFSVVIFFRG